MRPLENAGLRTDQGTNGRHRLLSAAVCELVGCQHAHGQIWMSEVPQQLPEDLERELVELRESCFFSEDFREGVRAFGEKRKPVWRDR